MIPLKLVFVFPSMKSGGGNRVFVELSNVLVKEFEEIVFIYPKNNKDTAHYEISKGIMHVSVGKETDNSFQKLRNVLSVFKELNRLLSEDPNIVIVLSDPIICALSFLIKVKYSSRIIRFIQADDYNIFDDLHVLKKSILLNIYKKLCAKNYEREYNYIFNSVFTYDQFLKVSTKRVPLHLVHPAINRQIFKFTDIKNGNELNIALVARKHPWKGFIDFLNAWGRLDIAIKEKVNNVYIISHDDLSQFNLENFKRISPDNDSEIAQVMNMSHIFISTSWWEGFGLPPLEAMSCGCAVLSSNSGGVLEYVKDNENCLLYHPKDVEGLTSKLEYMITNSSFRAEISDRGRQMAQSFSWENSGQKFIEIIKTMPFLIERDLS